MQTLILLFIISLKYLTEATPYKGNYNHNVSPNQIVNPNPTLPLQKTCAPLIPLNPSGFPCSAQSASPPSTPLLFEDNPCVITTVPLSPEIKVINTTTPSRSPTIVNPFRIKLPNKPHQNKRLHLIHKHQNGKNLILILLRSLSSRQLGMTVKLRHLCLILLIALWHKINPSFLVTEHLVPYNMCHFLHITHIKGISM